MTLNEYYAKKPQTEDERAVSDLLDYYISRFGNHWQDIYNNGQAEELVQKLWEMRIK